MLTKKYTRKRGKALKKNTKKYKKKQKGGSLN